MESLVWVAIGVFLTLTAVVLRRKYAAFHGQSPQDYEDTYPNFSIKKHLNGEMVCEGAIFGPLGRMTSTFVAYFDVSWEGDTGTMIEEFTYNDGSTQTREWTIHLGENGQFTTTAPDVPGQGIGVHSGATVQIRYPIKLPDDLGGHVLTTVDWMYLTPTGTIVNRSQFRKFGFKVAELVSTMRPKEAK